MYPFLSQVLREMCKQGYRDGLRFLRRNGVWASLGWEKLALQCPLLTINSDGISVTPSPTQAY